MPHDLSHDAEAFLAQKNFVTVDATRETPAVVPALAGIYGWWFDHSLAHISEGALSRDGLQLLYIGIAPRGPSREGVKPRTLRERLLNHCRGPLATSTLRRTLAALLKDPEGFAIERAGSGKLRMSAQDESKLTRWMNEHARIAWFPTPAPWLLEEELLKYGPRLPLNIRGSSGRHSEELRKLRSESISRSTRSGGL